MDQRLKLSRAVKQTGTAGDCVLVHWNMCKKKKVENTMEVNKLGAMIDVIGRRSILGGHAWLSRSHCAKRRDELADCRYS